MLEAWLARLGWHGWPSAVSKLAWLAGRAAWLARPGRGKLAWLAQLGWPCWPSSAVTKLAWLAGQAAWLAWLGRGELA